MEIRNKKNLNDLNSESLIILLFNWRKPLIIIVVISIILSSVASLLIENKYKSKVVLFPTTTSSISKALLSETNSGKEDVLRFGEEEEVEQMLQILNSDEIRDRIVHKYDLANHYNIEADEKFRNTKIQQQYESNVSFTKTKFMSIEIEVLDHNPDTAALIANDISSYIDTVKNRMRKEIAVEALSIVEKEYEGQNLYIESLEDSLEIIRSMGIINVRAQSERLTEQMAIAILEGKNKAAEMLKNQLDTLSLYAGTFTNIEDQITLENKRRVLIRARYREAKINAESNLQHKFVVSHAFPAEKKTYPIRWLIVVVSTMAALLLASLVMLIKEKLTLK